MEALVVMPFSQDFKLFKIYTDKRFCDTTGGVKEIVSD